MNEFFLQCAGFGLSRRRLIMVMWIIIDNQSCVNDIALFHPSLIYYNL